MSSVIAAHDNTMFSRRSSSVAGVAPVPSVEINIILHSHPEIEISFKFIPKILMSKECINFFGSLCMYFKNHIII